MAWHGITWLALAVVGEAAPESLVLRSQHARRLPPLTGSTSWTSACHADPCFISIAAEGIGTETSGNSDDGGEWQGTLLEGFDCELRIVHEAFVIQVDKAADTELGNLNRKPDIVVDALGPG